MNTTHTDAALAPILITVALVILLIVLLSSIRVAKEWNRAVILRLGRFSSVAGPGLYLVLPILDQVAAVIDMRIQTSSISAEQAVTRDTVSVGVDAIVFWQVVDAQAAAVKIANYAEAIDRVAQTTLREMIGATELAKLLSDRQSVDDALQTLISKKTTDWGVAVRSVEIRDVSIPAPLQDAMSRQAQAERERQARITLASVESAVAEQVVQAAKIYASNPVALQLRQMNLLYEMNKERGTTVLIPTDMAASLGAVMALSQAISKDLPG